MNKEIMELIQPYTDKTLSEGCYCILTDDYKEPQKLLNSHIEEDSDSRTRMNFEHWWEWKENVWDYNILWHYDITAVLKYIEDKVGIMVFISWDIIEIDNDDWGGLVWNIPNKPLSLYTEEEQTNLIGLLKKLWQT